MRRGRTSTTAGQTRGQIIDAVSIRDRPAEIEDRAIPGHWESDLMSGARNYRLIAAARDGRQFKKARDLAAWLGLVPAEHSTGGKQTLLGISKRSKRYVRRLIIHGARSCLLHLNRTNHALGSWLSATDARMHRNKAVVALANKLTRIVWAILTKGGTVHMQSKGAAAS